MIQLLSYISNKFPQLKEEIKWSQPMFTDHGTFIIGFSVAKNHIAIAPEAIALNKFEDDVANAGYERTKELFKIKWTDEINYNLLEKIIKYNIVDKKDHKKFWR